MGTPLNEIYKRARKKMSRWNGHPMEDRAPLTHLELNALAEMAVLDAAAFDVKYGTPPVTTVKDFTCHDCCDCSICEFVYDMYNTDGDCLASK